MQSIGHKMTKTAKNTKKKSSDPILVPSIGSQSGTQDERLYNEILEAILDHRLSPGLKLKEDELADIFSVSRTIVRRALLRLAHDQIVDMQPNRGATIIKPDVKKAREVLSARRLIERELIKEATLAATPKTLKDLRKCVKDERNQVQNQQIGSGLRLSGDFHIQLSLLANNNTLRGYLKELVPQTSLIIATYQNPHNTLCSHQEHADIIDIIATGDVDAAQAEMDAHLCRIEDKLELEEERTSGDLYAAFSHLKNKNS